MMVDAFGYPSMSVLALKEAMDDIVTRHPSLAVSPVWVDTGGLFRPVRNVLVNRMGRPIIEVHHG